jgi:hypothetical protein
MPVPSCSLNPRQLSWVVMFRRAVSASAATLAFSIHPVFAQCDITGGWRQTTPYGSSMWVFVPAGNGQYHVREAGFGNAVGTATVLPVRLLDSSVRDRGSASLLCRFF